MVLDENEDEVFIALETMAGKGSEIGRTFEEIKMCIRDRKRSARNPPAATVTMIRITRMAAAFSP